jgi:hypothetical protein
MGWVELAAGAARRRRKPPRYQQSRESYTPAGKLSVIYNALPLNAYVMPSIVSIGHAIKIPSDLVCMLHLYMIGVLFSFTAHVSWLREAEGYLDEEHAP